MEVRATAKYVRVQPRKVRIIADEIRGKDAEHSMALLRYHPSKGAKALHKVLVSAMANAKENHGLSPDSLRIATIMVDEGPRLKRMIAKAMGRGSRILKKTSHITVVVEDHEALPKVKPHGTKAKPRPTFSAPKGRRRGGPKNVAPAAETAAVVEETIVEAPIAESEPAVETAAPVAGSSPMPEKPTSSLTTPAGGMVMTPSSSDEADAKTAQAEPDVEDEAPVEAQAAATDAEEVPTPEEPADADKEAE